MREIKGPEDCTPRSANVFTEGGQMIPQARLVFTALDVGQIIALAMDAQRHLMSSVGQQMPNEQREKFLNNCKAWRELSERLKGM